MIRVPQTFIIDHQERDLPTPFIHKTTSHHFYIHEDDANLKDLIDDAEFYAGRYSCDCEPWLRLSARALLRAIDKSKDKK